MSVPCSRAVSRAASLITLARSAPDMPTVRLASDRKSTSAANGLPLEWTARTASRPFRSGALTGICRSNRPGRSNAGSRMSGRLVAAIRMMPPLVSKPSISTSSWFSVCSRSSWPPPMPAPRWRPTASISSMKTIAGALALACSNRSRTGRRPRRRTSRRSRNPKWCRTARRPLRRRPARAGSCRCLAARTTGTLGDLRAQRLVARRVLQEVTDLVEFLDRLVGPGNVREFGGRHVFGQQLGLRLAEREDLVPAALRVVHHPEQEQDDQADRNQVDEQREQRRLGGDLGAITVGDLGAGDGVEDLVRRAGRELCVDLRGTVDRIRQGQPEPLFLVVDIAE